MIYSELISVLEKNSNKSIKFYLGKECIPEHFHLTEVGRVVKTFIDCGGNRREEKKCLLQIWTANDIDHRLKSDKMLSILNMSRSIFQENEDLPVEVEYEDGLISQYFISNFELKNDTISFYLDKNHTACLAPDKCGVECCATPQDRLYKVQLIK